MIEKPENLLKQYQYNSALNKTDTLRVTDKRIIYTCQTENSYFHQEVFTEDVIGITGKVSKKTETSEKAANKNTGIWIVLAIFLFLIGIFLLFTGSIGSAIGIICLITAGFMIFFALTPTESIETKVCFEINIFTKNKNQDLQLSASGLEKPANLSPTPLPIALYVDYDLGVQMLNEIGTLVAECKK